LLCPTVAVVPVKLLQESLGHVITVELKTGQTYRGKLADGQYSLYVVCLSSFWVRQDGCEDEGTRWPAGEGDVEVNLVASKSSAELARAWWTPARIMCEVSSVDRMVSFQTGRSVAKLDADEPAETGCELRCGLSLPITLPSSPVSPTALENLLRRTSHKRLLTCHRLCAVSAEDSLNIALREVTVTARDGRVSQLDQVYIRGSMARFFIVPDMLANAPM
jgi:small nuclear ribonucleoprotein (snRNP)-like protein